MIRYLFIVITLFTLVSCQTKIDKKLERSLIASLQLNNATLDDQLYRYERSMEDKLNTAESKEKAEIWMPKFTAAITFAKETIDSLQYWKTKNDKSLSEPDKEKLYNQLIGFKQNLLGVDEVFKPEFANQMSITSDSMNGNELTEKEFCDNLTDATTLLRIAMLQNRVYKLRNMIARFCDIYSTPMDCGIVQNYYPLLIQNFLHFKKNEILNTNIGIGNFSKSFVICKIDGEKRNN